MSRKQLHANEYHANRGLFKQFVMHAHTSECFFRSAHAQGARTKRFSIVHFSKSSRTTYAQVLIFFNVRQH